MLLEYNGEDFEDSQQGIELEFYNLMGTFQSKMGFIFQKFFISWGSCIV